LLLEGVCRCFEALACQCSPIRLSRRRGLEDITLVHAHARTHTSCARLGRQTPVLVLVELSATESRTIRRRRSLVSFSRTRRARGPAMSRRQPLPWYSSSCAQRLLARCRDSSLESHLPLGSPGRRRHTHALDLPRKRTNAHTQTRTCCSARAFSRLLRLFVRCDDDDVVVAPTHVQLITLTIIQPPAPATEVARLIRVSAASESAQDLAVVLVVVCLFVLSRLYDAGLLPLLFGHLPFVPSVLTRDGDSGGGGPARMQCEPRGRAAASDSSRPFN
jgi:hypothetical protein